MRTTRLLELYSLACLLTLGCSESANQSDASELPSNDSTMASGSPSATASAAGASAAAMNSEPTGTGGDSTTPASTDSMLGQGQGGTGGMASTQSASGGSAVASSAATAGATGSSGGSAAVEDTRRELLSQTGLYSDIGAETLAEGVMPYRPQFELYTDGAVKRRWVYVPPGEQIDSSNIDEWKFPVGTKLWKEFSRDDIRIETRLLEKLPDERADEGFEGWLVMAYVWNDDQSDAVATPLGMSDAKGTAHDVPEQEACGRCHDMRVEKPLGFSAVQLAHDGDGATLDSLLAAGILSDPPAEPLAVPGDEQQRALLGYFHANCGHCHRARSPVNNRVASLRLWLESDALGSFEETEMYQAIVNKGTQSGQGSIYDYRVLGGDPDESEILRRIRLRAGDAELADASDEVEVPMPPLGTEQVDEPAVEMVRQFILSLPPPDTAL